MAHISFSELKDWVHCPFYHKITRVDKIEGFQGNAYTAFGTAMHSVCEKKLLHEEMGDDFFIKESISISESLVVFCVIELSILLLTSISKSFGVL